jgi:hypothetical protein
LYYVIGGALDRSCFDVHGKTMMGPLVFYMNPISSHPLGSFAALSGGGSGSGGGGSDASAGTGAGSGGGKREVTSLIWKGYRILRYVIESPFEIY